MTYDEEHLAELLSLLPPAPEAWVRAAQDLPRLRAQADAIVARAEADLEFRRRLVADLERALADAGYAAEPRLLDAVRERSDS